MSKSPFDSLIATEFVPLSEAKAKLSEKVRTVSSLGKKIAITTSGKPTAILLGYRDFLSLLKSLPDVSERPTKKIIEIGDWKKGEKKRKEISQSMDRLFFPSQLSRKGQKPYKRKKLREFFN